MVPLISEHDTWTSLEPIVGCPADCAYCFVRKYGRTSVRPQILVSSEEAVEAIVRYFDSDPAISEEHNPRFVSIGNYTDMFMTNDNRRYALDYSSLHYKRLPNVPLVFITKARLGREIVEELDQIGLVILFFISQSFFSWCQHVPSRLEGGVASPEASLENFQLLAKSANLKPLHFWRPLTRINVPDENAAIRQVRSVRDAGVLASVAVGLKDGDVLASAVMRADNPFHEIFREQDEKEFLDLQSPVGESFPSDLKELVLGVARMEGHPVYLNTSCAVSFALGMSDFLQTWRPPVRKVRCEPANCPEQQRARCFSQTLNRIPSAETIARISDYLAVPEGFVHWNELCQSITVETSLTQDIQCRLCHVSGFRVSPVVLKGTREWVGTFAGVGWSMNQPGSKSSWK